MMETKLSRRKKGYHPSILPTPKRTLKDRRQAATARPCPTTCSPRATAYVRSVSVHQILHTARRRLQSGKRQGNAHRAPTRPTMGFALTACWDFRRSLGAIQSQLLLWCLHRVRTLRSFSAGGRCRQDTRPPRRQGPAALGTHFSRRSRRTTLGLAQNWRKSLRC